MTDQFVRDLKSFGDKIDLLFDRVVHECCIGLTEELVRETPVRTGAARSNYFWSVGAPSNETTAANIDHNGQASLDRANAFRPKAGGTVRVTNSLFYIQELEFGVPGQTPHAMFRVAASRWKKIGAEAERRAMK